MRQHVRRCIGRRGVRGWSGGGEGACLLRIVPRRSAGVVAAPPLVHGAVESFPSLTCIAPRPPNAFASMARLKCGAVTAWVGAVVHVCATAQLVPTNAHAVAMACVTAAMCAAWKAPMGKELFSVPRGGTRGAEAVGVGMRVAFALAVAFTAAPEGVCNPGVLSCAAVMGLLLILVNPEGADCVAAWTPLGAVLAQHALLGSWPFVPPDQALQRVGVLALVTCVFVVGFVVVIVVLITGCVLTALACDALVAWVMGHKAGMALRVARAFGACVLWTHAAVTPRAVGPRERAVRPHAPAADRVRSQRRSTPRRHLALEEVAGA